MFGQMHSKLKISIGYQLPDIHRFLDIVAEYAKDIGEVYFPWLDVNDGRGLTIRTQEEKSQMLQELTEIHRMGIKLNMLWNANCYGSTAISKELKIKLLDAVNFLQDCIGVDTVTTTSLFVAETLKEEYPTLDLRASVNMGIGTISGMKYLKDYFDSFYLQRELNRFPEKIKSLKQWCSENGKKLYMLVNSGCLRFCSAHTFHDNLVSHENEIAQHENAWTGFRGVCWDFYSKPENAYSFLQDSTWIRPEDIDSYAGLVDGIKLATRSNKNPDKVIGSYVCGNFGGNMLSLCEPDFSGLCFIDNSQFPSSWRSRLSGLPDNEYENYCKEIFAHVKR